MKRRGFLGLIGASAVAGPAAAKSIVAELPAAIPSGRIGGGLIAASRGYDDVCTPNASNSNWRLDEIASIKRFLTGELNDEEKEERRRRKLHAREQQINQNVACLLSVSGSRKMAIFEDRMRSHYDEIERLERSQRLNWLLRQSD